MLTDMKDGRSVTGVSDTIPRRFFVIVWASGSLFLPEGYIGPFVIEQLESLCQRFSAFAIESVGLI